MIPALLVAFAVFVLAIVLVIPKPTPPVERAEWLVGLGATIRLDDVSAVHLNRAKDTVSVTLPAGSIDLETKDAEELFSLLTLLLRYRKPCDLIEGLEAV